MLQQPRAAVSTVVCVLSLEQFGVGTVVSRLIIVAIVEHCRPPPLPPFPSSDWTSSPGHALELRLVFAQLDA